MDIQNEEKRIKDMHDKIYKGIKRFELILKDQ